MNSQTKAKIFALYYGQSVYMNPAWEQLQSKSPVSVDETILTPKWLKGGYLSLRPIHSLTDEEAIQAALLTTDFFNCNGVDVRVTRNVKEPIYVWGFFGSENIKIAVNDCGLNISGIDYLRSIGIALPVTVLEEGQPITYSVEKLIEEGVFKIENI